MMGLASSRGRLGRLSEESFMICGGEIAVTISKSICKSGCEKTGLCQEWTHPSPFYSWLLFVHHSHLRHLISAELLATAEPEEMFLFYFVLFYFILLIFCSGALLRNRCGGYWLLLSDWPCVLIICWVLLKVPEITPYLGPYAPSAINSECQTWLPGLSLKPLLSH